MIPINGYSVKVTFVNAVAETDGQKARMNNVANRQENGVQFPLGMLNPNYNRIAVNQFGEECCTFNPSHSAVFIGCPE